MIGSWGVGSWRRAATGPFLLGFFTLVLLLQAFAAFGVSHARQGLAVDEARGASFYVDGPCAGDRRSNEPGRRESDACPACCLFCPASAFEGPPACDAAETGLATIPLPTEPVSFGGLSYDTPRNPSSGWATSWSSQAPPRFS